MTEWLDDFRASLSEIKGRGGVRYFLETSAGVVWAVTKLRLGLGVAFRRSVVQAADACEAEDKGRGSGSSVAFREMQGIRRPRGHGVLALGQRVLGRERHAWAGEDTD